MCMINDGNCGTTTVVDDELDATQPNATQDEPP